MDSNKILDKVKMKIAISNSNKEDIVMNKTNINKMKKGIGIAACVVLGTTGICFAANEIIHKFGLNASEGVDRAVENGYYSVANTKYKEANGINACIESFVLDSDNFAINIDFDFKNNNELYKEINTGVENKFDILDLKVVNEKNEKIFATRELESEEKMNLYQTEEEARKKYDSYSGAYGTTYQKIEDGKIRYQLTATGNDEDFPSSKNIIVTFKKISIGKDVKGKIKESIYEGEWKFEIEVPEYMQKSSKIEYKLENISEKNYKFEKATLSNTAFKIYLNDCKGIVLSDKSYVETTNGNKYYPARRSDGDGAIFEENGIIKYYNTFNLTKFDASNELKVHLYKDNGEEVIIELKAK